MTTAVDTTKVTERRTLHFANLDALAADVEALAAARERRTLGNWSGGQILQHLAIMMHGSLDGLQSLPPWPIRVIARLFLKNRFLTKPMSAGFQLPKNSHAELVPAETSWDDGLSHIRAALRRLKTETKRAPSPLFGPLTAAEWEQLHCRHAELHLSFLVPVN